MWPSSQLLIPQTGGLAGGGEGGSLPGGSEHGLPGERASDVADGRRHWRERLLGDVLVLVEVVRGARWHGHGHGHLLAGQGLRGGGDGAPRRGMREAVATPATAPPAAVQVGLVDGGVGHARRGQHHGRVQVLQHHKARVIVRPHVFFNFLWVNFYLLYFRVSV